MLKTPTKMVYKTNRNLNPTLTRSVYKGKGLTVINTFAAHCLTGL